MNYAYIEKDNMLNGEGLRVILWVTGCPHHCEGCHNPWSWDPNEGKHFDSNAYLELVNELKKDYVNGITFLGGEPLAPYNLDTVTSIAKTIREEYPKKTIWCYTGYTYEDIEKYDIMKYLDVLIDGEFIKELKDVKLYWRGSSNQRVIDIKETRKTGKVVLYTTE